jgi:hypothetical protein
MLIKFGIWEIHEDFGIIGKVSPTYDYPIHKEKLWDTKEYKGKLVWDWLIHLTEKNWLTLENVNDLNTAFLFGQDYFKKSKPKKSPNISTSKTIYLQRQLIEIGVKFDKEESELGTDLTSPSGLESMFKYLETIGNIKFLEE